MSSLLISIRFYDGRYHGSGDWPPSPARLFQALVAGAARGEKLSECAVKAFEWLESLNSPVIAAPSNYAGQSFRNFVPNNDLDAVGGDPARIGEIRTAKVIRPCTFDAATSVLYAWTFEHGDNAERHALTIREIADCLYQLGRGVDMAWAQGEVVAQGEADIRLTEHSGVLWRPNESGKGATLACPHPGSLASLTERFKKSRERFKTAGNGKKTSQLFSQAPKRNFRQVPYESPCTFLLFDIKMVDAFVPQPFMRVATFAEMVRDKAAARLKKGLPQLGALVDRVFIGREAKDADKAQRIRITPLPSIGHAQTEHSVRRVLVAVPSDCPVATSDIAWTFSGLTLDSDPVTGEVPDDAAMLVTASDRSMLTHYGIEAAAPARLWRTVTPAALPERAARRRIDPRRMREEAKGGPERLHEHAAADQAARQALRHTGIATAVHAIRVQREPFESRGQRAEAFAPGTRFSKERLWHVEIAFAEPVTGPLIIGDGRYLGLGLLAPVRRTEGVLAFAIKDGLTDEAETLALTRALRRAVMARVQVAIGEHAALPAFFSGHSPDGAPARSGAHQHLAFVFDAPRQRLLIVAPHALEGREASANEIKHLRMLEGALEDFHELRAGQAGKLSLLPCLVGRQDDSVFARSRTWESLTPYRVTRHAKLGDAAAALKADLRAECQRAGLPRPEIEVSETFGKPSAGLFGRAKLTFWGCVDGPLLLGRDRHFGGGLFAAPM